MNQNQVNQQHTNQSVRTVLVALGLLLVVILVGSYYWINQAGELAVNEVSTITSPPNSYQSQDWTLTNLEGDNVTLSDYKGRPVLLVFWATWCPYCKKLLPGIAELNEKYGSKGLKVIAVNIKEDWKPHVYWKNHEYKFDAVLEGDEVAELYGVARTPTNVFIDPDGKVLAVKSFSDPQNPLLEAFAKEFVSSVDH